MCRGSGSAGKREVDFNNDGGGARSSSTMIVDRVVTGAVSFFAATSNGFTLTWALAVISTYAQMLAKQVAEDSQKSLILDKIAKQTFRASEIVNRIRALVKKAPPQKERLHINEAIHEVVGLTHSEAAKNGVLVQTQLRETLPPIRGDRVQLQ